MDVVDDTRSLNHIIIPFTEVQRHSVQRNTKAKKHATSNVGSLKSIKLSSVIVCRLCRLRREIAVALHKLITIINNQLTNQLNNQIIFNFAILESVSNYIVMNADLASYYWIQGFMLHRYYYFLHVIKRPA